MCIDQNELIYLSLGSNLGDRQKNLEAAERLLQPLVKVEQKSQIYETEPWGFQDQPRFLNRVLAVMTSLSPLELLAYLKDIEKAIGRKPSFRFGPREVDIDILLYGNQFIDQESLVIPHARLSERSFVLVPLAEIAPDLFLPGSEFSVTNLLESIDTSDVYPFQE
jgi:2-amino-4-hydroxy-6-hydroxymethyldihydropteridine diphosphokinase